MYISSYLNDKENVYFIEYFKLPFFGGWGASRICSKHHKEFLYSFHLASFARLQAVHPNCNTDTASLWKKSLFILSVWSDFYMNDNLSIVSAIALTYSVYWHHFYLMKYYCQCMLTGLLIFRGLPLNVETDPSCIRTLFYLCSRWNQCLLQLIPGYTAGIGIVYKLLVFERIN